MALETIGFMDKEMSNVRGPNNSSFGMLVIDQHKNVQIGMGNILRPRATEPDPLFISPVLNTESKMVTKRRKYPSNNPYYLPHCMLNLTNYHSQLWPSVVQHWKSVVTQE